MHTLLPAGHGTHRLAQVAREALRKCLPTFLALGMYANFIEIKEVVQQSDIPIGSSSRADMPKHLAALPRQIFAAERRHGARAHAGERSGIENRLGSAGGRIEEIQ